MASARFARSYRARPHISRRTVWLVLEHGYDQAERVQTLLREAGFRDVESRRDLAGFFA